MALSATVWQRLWTSDLTRCVAAAAAGAGAMICGASGPVSHDSVNPSYKVWTPKSPHERKVVTSWEELSEELFERRKDVIGASSPFLYRGHSFSSAMYKGNHPPPIVSSLQRAVPGDERLNIEYGLLRSFKKYAGANQPRGNAWWEWLALAEHHSLPTRMVNFSHSPFVALHFSTLYDKKPTEGYRHGILLRSDALPVEDPNCVEIWRVDAVACHNASSKIAKYLQSPHAGSGKVLTIDQLEDLLGVTAEVASGDPAKALMLLEHLGGDVAFVEPPTCHDRAVAQHHVYAIAAKDICIWDWLVSQPGVLKVIVIPPELVAEVRWRLDTVGINERTIMGGLDGLCDWLRRHYKVNQ